MKRSFGAPAPATATPAPAAAPVRRTFGAPAAATPAPAPTPARRTFAAPAPAAAAPAPAPAVAAAAQPAPARRTFAAPTPETTEQAAARNATPVRARARRATLVEEPLPPTPVEQVQAEVVPDAADDGGAAVVPGAAPDEVMDVAVGDDVGVSVRMSAMPIKEFEGEIETSDFAIPSFKTVQSIGPLSESFEAGCFVVGGEFPISNPGGDVELVVIRAKKYFEQNIPWGSDERALTAATLEEVKAMGGWTDWRDQQRPPFSPVLMCLVAILQPEGAEDSPFNIETEHGKWGLFVWKLKSTSYTSAAKPILTEIPLLQSRSVPIASQVWNVNCVREERGGNLVWVPKVKRAGTLPEPLLNAVLAAAGSGGN